MQKFAIIYYTIYWSAKSDLMRRHELHRRVVKEIPTDMESEDEVYNWLESLETELAKEFLETDVEFYDNVSTYITNIVRL